VSQHSLNNDNQQYMSSSDEDGNGHQGGVNIQNNDYEDQDGVTWQHPIRQPIGPPQLLSIQELTGFSRFVRDHISPTHKRVTAGGRVVPAGPLTPPVTFTKPFLDEFIKVADRVLQARPQPAQVIERDNNGGESSSMRIQQSNYIRGNNPQNPVIVHTRVPGNPFGNSEWLAQSDEEATNAAKVLLLLPGMQVISVGVDGSNIVFYEGLQYRGSKMGNKTRYDLLFWPDGDLARGDGRCIVLEEAQPSVVLVDDAATSAAGGQTQDPQLQTILTDGTLIFLFRGKLRSAKLHEGQMVYGDVVIDENDPRVQIQHPMPTVPPVTHPTNADNLATYQSKMQVLTKQLALSQSELKALDQDHALYGHNYDPTQQTEYAQRRGIIVNLITDVRHAIKRLERARPAGVAAGYEAGPSNLGPSNSGPSNAGPSNSGPSISGLVDRTNQPHAKKQLSPEALPFVPGSHGFAGPSSAGPSTARPLTAGPFTAGPTSAPLSHTDATAHLRNDSIVTWNDDMERSITPSIDSVIAMAWSNKGKHKAVEYSEEELLALAPISVRARQGVRQGTREWARRLGFGDSAEHESGENEAEEGSDSSVDAKEDNTLAQTHFHDSDPISTYPHQDAAGNSWVRIHNDKTSEGAEARAIYLAERIAKYLEIRGINEETLLQHLFGENRMAKWEPLPGETGEEFFIAYFTYKIGYAKAKRSIKPDSPEVFPDFNLPAVWVANQTSGDTSDTVGNRQAVSEQLEEIRAIAEAIDIEEASRSAESRQVPTDENRPPTTNELQATTQEDPQATINEQSQVTAQENRPVAAQENRQVTAQEIRQVTSQENVQATALDNHQATTGENTQATTEKPSGNASQAKENASHHRNKSSVSKHSGDELADTSNSALVVRERRLSRKSVSFGESSGQMMTYQTGESSNNPRGTNLTLEDRAFMQSMVQQQINETLANREVEAYIEMVTNAKLKDIRTSNDNLVAQNIITQQAAIDKEVHKKLAQTKKELARTKKEIEEHKKLIKEQERELNKYQKTPTPPRGATKGRQRSGQKTNLTLPKYGESGHTLTRANPEANIPPRPNWDTNQPQNFDQRPAYFQNQHHRYGGPQMGQQMGTPNRQHMGFYTGTPGRQPMGPPQTTPPHMVHQMGRPQITPQHVPSQMGPPPHMVTQMGPHTMGVTPPYTVPQTGPSSMGPMHALPSHMGPQMNLRDAHFGGYGTHGMGNPMMDQRMIQPIPQPRYPPPMGPEQVMGPPHMGPQHTGHPNMMGRQNMGQLQMGNPNMGPQHIGDPQINEMTGPPNMGHPQAIAPQQMMGRPNVGPPQMHHARFDSQETRLIEQGNLFNDYRNEDTDNHQMGRPMPPPQLGPSPFETQDVRNMGQGSHGFGHPQMMGPPMGSAQTGPPNMRRSYFESQDVRVTGYDDRGFGHRRNHRTISSEEMGSPCNDPSFLNIEEDAPFAGYRATQLNYGIDNLPTAPPVGPPQTTLEMIHHMHTRNAQTTPQIDHQMQTRVDPQTNAQVDDQMHSRNPRTNQQLDHQMNVQMEAQMQRQIIAQMHGQMDDQTNGQMRHQMSAREMNELMYDEMQAELDDQMQAQLEYEEMNAQRHGRRNPQVRGRRIAQMQRRINTPIHGQIDAPRQMTTHSMTPESARPSGFGNRGFVGNARMEREFSSTSPEETPSSRRGNRRIGTDQIMSSRESGSPEATRSSGRRYNRYVGNGQAIEEHTSGSPEDTRSFARAENRRGEGQMMAASPFDHRNVSTPYAAPFGRSSRSPEEDTPPQNRYQNFGAVGSRLPPPSLADYKFPDPGHRGRPRPRDDTFINPFREEDQARAAQFGLLSSPRLF